MKRLFVTLLLLICVCSLTFSYTANGVGTTLDEAKAEAVIALGEKIFPEFKTGESEDMLVSILNEIYPSILDDFPFRYTIQKEYGGYTVLEAELTGDDSTLSYFEDSIFNELDNIELYYDSYLFLQEEGAGATERRELLYEVLKSYELYYLSYNLFLRLGGAEDDSYSPSIPSKAVIRLLYQSLLDEEGIEVSASLARDRNNESLKAASDSNEAAKKSFEDTLYIRKAQETIHGKLILESKIESYLDDSGYRVREIDEEDTSFESFKRDLTYISEAQNLLAGMSNEYDSLRAEVKNRMESAVEDESAAIRNRAYPTALIGKDGNPTAIGKQGREDEVALLREEKDADLEASYTIIDSAFQSGIQERYNYFYGLLEIFKNKKYTLYSENYDFSVTPDPSYDGDNLCWYISFSIGSPVNYSSSPVQFSYYTVYGGSSTASNKEAVKKALILSSSYQQNVESTTSLLNNGDYDARVSFKLSPDLKNGVLTVLFSGFSLSFDGEQYFDMTLSDTGVLVSMDFDDADYDSYSWIKTLDEQKAEEEAAKKKAEEEEAAKKKAEEEAAAKKKAEEEAAAKKKAEEEEAAKKKAEEEAEAQKNTRTESSAVTKTSSSVVRDIPLASSGSSSKKAKTKTPFKFDRSQGSVEVGMYLQLMYGEAFDSRLKWKLESCIGINTYYSSWAYVSFLLNVSRYFSGLEVASIYQAGIFIGLGARIANFVNLSALFSYNSNGFIIYPQASVLLGDKDNEVQVLVTAGCYYNIKTGKYGITVGFGMGGDSF